MMTNVYRNCIRLFFWNGLWVRVDCLPSVYFTAGAMSTTNTPGRSRTPIKR